MKYKLIEEQVTSVRYKCPICPSSSANERSMTDHVLDHEWKELKRECKNFGPQARFESEEQAKRFLQLYKREWNTGNQFGDHYDVLLKWEGHGIYCHGIEVEIRRDEDGNREYEITFRKTR